MTPKRRIVRSSHSPEGEVVKKSVASTNVGAFQEYAIVQFEEALAALRAGDDNAESKIKTALHALGIKIQNDNIVVGDISHAVGVAVGHEIQMTVNQFGLSEQSSELLQNILNHLERYFGSQQTSDWSWEYLRKEYLEGLASYYEEWSGRYTDLRLTTDIRVASYKGRQLKTKNQQEMRWFRDALGTKDNQNHLINERVVILGDPGSGKTTACQRFVWELSQEGLVEQEKPSEIFVPVYLELGGYRYVGQFRDLAPYQRILSLIAQEMSQRLTKFGRRVLLNWNEIEEIIFENNCCFIFDGLNEVGTLYREELVSDIIEFIETYSEHGHQFILTTRKMDFEYDFSDLLPLDLFDVFEILELNGSGVNELVMRDLGLIAEAYRLAGTLNKQARDKMVAALDYLKVDALGKEAKIKVSLIEEIVSNLQSENDTAGNVIITKITDAQKLLALLRAPLYARVLWLAQNPATLKDIVDVYQVDEKIPRNRARLFERAVEIRMLTQSQKIGGQRARFPLEFKFDVLQVVAYEMMKPAEGLQLTAQRVMSIFGSMLESVGLRNSDADNLRKELIFSDGILVERMFGNISFIKQPYQEYFVARALRKLFQSALQARKNFLHDKLLGQLIGDPAYYRVVSIMAGLLNSAEATTFVTTLFKQKSTQRLAAMCIRHTDELPPNIIDNYLSRTRKNITLFTLLPENFISTSLILAFFLVYIVSFSSIAGMTSLLSKVAMEISTLRLMSVFQLDWISDLSLLAVPIVLWGGRYYLRRRINPIEQSVWWISLFPIVIASLYPLTVMLGVPTNISAFLASLYVFIFLLLFVNIFTGMLVPIAKQGNNQLEEYIVTKHLIRYLEIMREIGPNANSAIIEIQEQIKGSHYKHLSDRIKDAILRTWAISPRTAIQIIRDVTNPEQQADAVRVLGGLILQEETSRDEREDCVTALWQILTDGKNLGACLGAIDALGNLAAEHAEYKGRIVGYMEKVYHNPAYSIEIRRKAWQVLKVLGIKLSWPRPPFWKTALMATTIAIGVVAIIILWLSL